MDVVVDSLRNVLYTLHRDGTLDLYDLGVSGNQTTLKVRVLLVLPLASTDDVGRSRQFQSP